MNLLAVIASGFREIRAHWFRSALTMFGVICGVSSLITMGAFVKGKENLLRESLAQSGGLERITIESEDDLPDYQKHLEDEIRGITLKDVYALKNNAPLVYNITPIVKKMSFRSNLKITRKGKSTRFTLLQGTWPEALDIMEHEIEHGRMFTEIDDYFANNVCVIGTEIRNSLFGEYDENGETIIPINENIFINYKPFKVIGMFKEYMTEEDRKKKEEAKKNNKTINPADRWSRFRFSDSNSQRTMRVYGSKNSSVLLPLNTLVSKLDSSFESGSEMDRSLSELSMKVRDASLLEKSLQQVRNVLLRTHNGLEDFEFETQEAFSEDITLAIYNERISGMFIAGICLLVGGIGIINIMLSSISERVREIGIRKSIGATNLDVFTQIITESIVLAVSGGIIGLAISPVLINTLASYAPDTTPPIMTITSMIIGFSFSVITGCIAGLIPAIKAAKLDPIEALRYD